MPWKKTGRRSWQRKRLALACSRVRKSHSKNSRKADFRNELKRKDLAMSQMSPGSDQNVRLLCRLLQLNTHRVQKSATPTRPAPGPTSGLQASFSRIEQLHDDTLVEFQIKDMLNVITSFLVLNERSRTSKDLEFTDSPRHIGKAKPVMKPAPPQRKPFVPVVKVINIVPY